MIPSANLSLLPVTSAFSSPTSLVPFVDWISLFQGFGDGWDLPVVGAGRSIKSDLDMVEMESESIRYLRHEGSFSTTVFVRSDGRNVSQWGNVGRWCRPDNVWNLDWPATFDRAGEINRQKGLPAFSVGEHYIRPVVNERDARLGLFDGYTGAKVSELHLTHNFSAGGDAAARDCLRYMTGQRAARLSKSRLGATTVVFGSHASGGRQVQVYLKADEMLAHAKGEKAKAEIKDSQIYQFARDVGLVRVEIKMRRMALRDAGMNYAGGITMGKIVNLFAKHTQFLQDASPDRLVRVVDAIPAKLRLVALGWLRGDDVANLLHRRTFYRYAKALREYGFDISEPRPKADDADSQLLKLLDTMPRFELRPLQQPEWYDAEAEWGQQERKAA